MTQYIPKAAIIAEIDRLQNTTMDEDKNFPSSYHIGIFDGLSMMENFLDTLEVEEVDLEKEIEKYLLTNAVFLIVGDSKLVVHQIAKHFFELGLKARKEA